MARIRTVKPEMRRSLTVSAWPREVRLAFIYLWMYLDDEGRGYDDLRLIRSECFPLDDDVTTRKLDKWLEMMATDKNPANEWPPLCRYEVAGRRYIHSVYWTEHQRINRPQASVLPPCPIHDDAGNDHGSFTESSVNAHDTITEPSREERNKGKERKGTREAAEKPPPRVDVERLCSRLLELMIANGCRDTTTVTEKWRDAARLLLDRDRVPLDDALAVLEWSQANEFWKSNIQSLPTFREKYDRLRLQAERDPSFRRQGVSPSEQWKWESQ